MKRSLLLTAALLVVVPDIVSAQALRDMPHGDRRPPQGRPDQGRPGGGGGRPDRPNPGGPTTRPTPPHVRPVHPGGQIRPPRPGKPPTARPRPPQHRPGAGRPPHFRPAHARPFRYPAGYRYRRWTIGLLLPHLFLASPYFYDDYWVLGIGAPPPGYRWVRYGPDLLLVNVRTHRIADVIYGAFY